VKRIAEIACLALAAFAVRRRLAMRDALAAVAADLRSPVMPFLPSVSSSRTLPLWRLQFLVHTPSGRGVTVAKHQVGDPAVRVFQGSSVLRGLLFVQSSSTL
jgi:hypothetical protein